jgi:stage II sporulation protein D
MAFSHVQHTFADHLKSYLKSWLERSRKGWGFAVITWLFLIAPATALELRIAVKDEVSQVQIGSSTDAVIKDSSGQAMGSLEGMNGYSALANNGTINLQNFQGEQLWVEPENDGYIWIGDRWYRGRTLLIPQGNELLAINYVDLEEYLYSVVGAEAVPSWPTEALKAQAVAARTYALHKRAQVSHPLYDLDTTTNTQVYRGLETEYRSTHAAVDATAGQVMTYNGEIILAVFHAASGGHTENAGDIWSSTLPYLQGVIDYDQGTPAYQWRKSFSSQELADLIEDVGTVEEMIPERTTPRGRVVTMKIVGDLATKRMSGADLRKMLGLRSTLFQVQANGGYFQISGRGFGHGVGMSQWGAYNMARQGQDYRRILAHYYQNTIISQIEVY